MATQQDIFDESNARHYCSRCGKPLRSPKSIERGAGEVCDHKLHAPPPRPSNRLLGGAEQALRAIVRRINRCIRGRPDFTLEP